MEKHSPEVKELRQAIENAADREIKTPADFEFLAGEIWKKTKITISPTTPTTLKRLWGYISGSDTIRLSTLNILSRYLGFCSWNSFLAQLCNSQSDFITNKEIKSCSLALGARVEVAWQPNRHCIFEHLGNEKFVVLPYSQNPCFY